MTTELKKDQVSGRYWLCESTEILAKPIISQDLKESLKVSNGKAGTLIVKNIPVTILNRENMNGRIYTTQVLEEAIAECKRLNKFADKSMLGKGNEHPEDSFIAPTDASHAVINCYIKKNIPIIVEGKKERHDVLFQDWEIFNTHNGKDLRALIEAGASFGTSIRGLGDLEGKYVKNYSIISCDCVGNPSSSTFSGMPVAESVVESVKEDNSKKPLKEEFVISSSSTTVMKDMEQASKLAMEIDELNYGTVVKTSTKVDDETDPKTGVSTSLVTFEAETEDKATDLDTALMLAKRAILNGKVDIDSVTIENVKEDQPKESTENNDASVLNENNDDDDDTESYGVCSWCGDKLPLSDLKKERDFGYLCNQCAKGLQSREGPLNFEDKYEPEYVPESKINKVNTVKEAKEEKEEDPNTGKKFILKTPQGFVAMDGNALVFKQNPKEALHFIVGKEETGLVHLSKVQEILDTMGVYDVEKYYKKDITDISAPEEGNGVAPKGNSEFAPKEEQGNETLPESAKMPFDEFLKHCHARGGDWVSMLLSGIKEINPEYFNKIPGDQDIDLAQAFKMADEAGVDVSEYYNNTVKEESNEELTEDNGSNTRFSAEVAYDKGNGNLETNTVPVSGVELDSILAEVGNLYDMKSQKANGPVSIKVTDTQSGQVYQYNKQNNSLDPVQSADTNMADVQQEPKLNTPIQEGNGEIEQNANELKVDLDKDHSVTKKFDTVAQASIAKAGMEQGKLNGDVMLSEEDQKYEDAPDYDEENVEFGWYALSPNTDAQGRPDLIGPFESEEEAKGALAEVIDMVEIFEVTPDGIHQGNDVALAAESNLDEKIFSNPTNYSDEFVSVPLKDSDNLKFSLDNIDWDINSVVDKLYDGEFVDIDNLPDHLEVELTEEEFQNVANVEELMNVIKNKASEQIGIRINNAVLDRIA